jgi:hypothetical protein
MKKLLITLGLLPIVLGLLLAALIGVAIQQDKMSKSDLRFLVDLGKRHGPGAIVDVITRQVYGVDSASGADPSYGRTQIAGRGLSAMASWYESLSMNVSPISHLS